ncbi:uncharacterized protein NPIL_267251 [Nephila pilipes]|uniref:Uncharacterized protein n=1 Tax=Nephila pilipes TaxID=299642 RepID=A0A8X6T1Q5_NEPPI|nr:uncharacterized protein NPIL_267251 [Nephila pilipes]
MGLLKIATVLAFCLTTCFATYGSEGHHGSGSHKSHHIDSPKIHLDSPKIHLDSPKILVNKPKIHVEEDHHLIDDEPIYHSVHSSSAAVAPILINGGYGGYGGAKVLNVGGPLLVAPSPIVHHDGPILVRRPVLVAKELSPTQDHLEKIHYDRLTHGKGYISSGHGHGAILSTGHGHGAVISAGHGHRAIISGGHGHGAILSGGHGHGAILSNGHGHGTILSNGHGHGAILSNGHGHGTIISNGLGHGSIISAGGIGKGLGDGAILYEKAAPLHTISMEDTPISQISTEVEDTKSTKSAKGDSSSFFT